MFGNILKKVGMFMQQIGEKVQDLEEGIIELKDEVPQYVRMQKARWGINRKGNIALLGYYCPNAQKNCEWYGMRCSKCMHR